MATTNKKRNLISIILSQHSYPDRFEMLARQGAYVDEHVILTRDPVEGFAQHSNTTVVFPEEPIAGAAYWRWVAEEVIKRLEHESADARWLVHEHVVGFASFLLKLRQLRNDLDFSTIVSVYAAEVTFLRERHWRIDPYGEPFGVGQTAHYVAIFLKKLFQHVVSWAGADYVTGNSAMVARDVAQLFRSKHVHIIPTCVDNSFFCRQETIDEDLVWEPDKLRLLYVGQLAGFKGFGVLMSGLRRLIDAGYPVQLVLLGGHFPFDQHWIEQVIDRYGVRDHIVRLGRIPREQLVSYYNTADVFVCPSFHEGSPRVVKEALACGCPVVASDIPGSRIVDPAADVIRFFEPGDAKRMAELIGSLADSADLRAQLAEKGIELAQRFSPDAVAQKFADLYEQLW